MGFFGIKKKLAKFTRWEKQDIENFVKKATLDIGKKNKIYFKYDLDSSDEDNLKHLEIPRANAYAGNKWADRAFDDTYIHTDIISYNIFKNEKKINKINFSKYYTNRIVSNDFVSFLITLEKGDKNNWHEYEHHHGLGFRFHHRYNNNGQLPSSEQIDYSGFEYSPTGVFYMVDKNGKNITEKWKKPESAEKEEFEDYKNVQGRGYEDFQKYLKDQRERIVKLLKKN